MFTVVDIVSTCNTATTTILLAWDLGSPVRLRVGVANVVWVGTISSHVVCHRLPAFWFDHSCVSRHLSSVRI